MKLRTKRDVIRGVAARWRNQYEGHITEGTNPFGLRGYSAEREPDGAIKYSDVSVPKASPREIYDRLLALDLEVATAAEVDAVIRSAGSWCELRCEECYADVEQVAVLEHWITKQGITGVERHPEDVEEETRRQFLLCVHCVFAGFKLLEQI